MNVEFVNPFLQSLLNVLATMAQVNASHGSPFLKRESVAKGDVTGIIGLAGALAKGSLAITFTESVILEISTRMLMEEYKDVNDEVADMVGEITNMVTGGAKRMLAEKGYKFEMAIPTTVVGKSHTIRHKINGPVVCVPFETEWGPFYVEICMISR